MLPSAYPDRPEDDEPGSPVRPARDDRANESVDWLRLPEPIRDRVAELAAAALGKLPSADVPRQLRPVARFAPAKRAKLGAIPLLSVLGESAQFRTTVLEWLREHRQDVLDPNAEDNVAAAVAALLLGESSASSRIRLVARNAEETMLRAERDAAVARAQRLETELERLRLELEQAHRTAAEARSEREAELVRLRGRLREQGVVLRQAKDAAEQVREDAAQADVHRAEELSALRVQLDRERQRVAAERTRAERAVADADVARQSAKEARDADEARLALLVDTLGGAVEGLRHELALGPTRRRPADQVRGARSGAHTRKPVADAAALERVLGLPNVHLIVDGYNVTKTGYPELALSDQRERLVRQLAALSARTGAEITVVFDGAAVVSVPLAAPRGVRVLFSDPGVLADDVIRALVRGEPGGRPLVVATSDRAVVASVAECGAHAVPSAVLLTKLGRV